MKKFLLTAIILLPTLMVAQNGIQISNFSVSAAGSVTLDISWKADGMPTLWLDSAWVFVDYNNNGVMKRLPLLPGATILNPSAQGAGYGIVIEEAGNNQGVWVVGKTRGTTSSFSATVVLPFNAATDVKGACAYASNYPPFGTWNSAGTELTLTGTPPYLMQVESGTVTKIVQSGSPFLLPSGYVLKSFTDQTGAPGIINCVLPTAPTSLMASASTVCSGTLVTFTATGGSDGSKSQFEWGTGTVGVGGTLTTSTTYSAIPTSTTTYWVRRASTDGCGITTAVTTTVTVNTYPTINAQPTSSQTVCMGNTVSLSVTATNASAYQWKNGSSNASGTGTTTSAFTGLVSTNSTFTVVVTSSEGCSVTSNQALVTKTGNAPGETVAIAAFNPCASAPTASTWTVIDSRDSKQYRVVKMPDDRIWFAQNLNFQTGLTFRANSNQPFTSVTNGVPGIGSFWCPPSANGATTSSQSNCDIYGALYTWETAMMPDGNFNTSVTAWSEAWVSGNYFTSGAPGTSNNAKINQGRTNTGASNGSGICPTNWHVPTAFEWVTMLDRVDNSTVFSSSTNATWSGNNTADKIRATATTSVNNPGANSWPPPKGQNNTNSSGFNVLPSNMRLKDGSSLGNTLVQSIMWSSTVCSTQMSAFLCLHADKSTLMFTNEDRSYGFGVRCIK